jgi:anthranilate phosphoribosyltransferase
MNAAFALRLLKGEFSTKEAFRIALDAIESGKAKQTLDSLVNFTASVHQKNLYKK